MSTQNELPGDASPPADTVVPEPARRRWLRRPSRRVALLLAVPPVLLVLAFLVFYARTDVPRPESLASPQVSVITYDDGSELGRVGAQNRIEVPLSKVSEPARNAVLAAENRDFYSEPGISPKGIVRALLANLRGGGVKQGASTITQQYAKNAYLSQERTVARKLREVVIALKLERSYSKDEVLEFYLNTVYFGRGAYGIEVAAQTYFGKPAAKLSAAEGAVLAALLRSPSAYDPDRNPGDARARWDYVVKAMQQEGWADGGMTYPKVLPKRSQDQLAGPQGYLVQQVQDELEAHGVYESQIRSGGLRITTTLSRRAQAEAVKAVEGVTGRKVPAGLHRALVAVEPGTGRIRAEYAGSDYVARPFNDATQGSAQAGSSFKPFVLAAALDSSISLKTKMKGASPQKFGDYEVRNYGDHQYPEIDLVQATAQSVNTVYVPLGQRAGLPHVADVASRLGITTDMSKESSLPSFSLGVTAVRPIDQAAAYAALAARGVHAKPFLVQKVTDPEGNVVYAAQRKTTQALSTDVADDTTFALQAVVTAGTGRAAELPGRPSAGKTGTTTGNTAAWFVGYTPQLATAVALFSDRPDLPLRGIAGVEEVTGGTLPARTWNRFMAAAHQGMPVKAFPPPAYGGVEPSPSPSPSPTASPSASPTPSPLPSSLLVQGPGSEPSPAYGSTEGESYGGTYTYDGSGTGGGYSPAPEEPSPSPAEQYEYAEPSPSPSGRGKPKEGEVAEG